jgi:sec-independent protein translocase protein TatA
MFGLGVPELGLILVIILVLFGAKNLPDIGKAFGKTIREFRNATSGELEKTELEKKQLESDSKNGEIKK